MCTCLCLNVYIYTCVQVSMVVRRGTRTLQTKVTDNWEPPYGYSEQNPGSLLH